MNLMLALALVVCQETPEQAFRKIEAEVERSKNVKVLFKLWAKSEGETVSRGTFTMEGETRMKMSADLRGKDGSRIAIWTEYENQKIRSSFADHRVEVKGEGRPVRANFNVYLTRLGIFAGGVFEHGFWTGAGRGGGASGISVDLKQMFTVKNFTPLGEGKNGTQGFSYDLVAAFKPMPFKWAKVWYDPKTYRIARREALWEFEGKEETITEEYEFQGEDGKPIAKPTPTQTAATEAEADVLFIQAKIQVANEHLTNGRKQKAVDVLEDLALSFPKHSLYPEIKRLLEQAKK